MSFIGRPYVWYDPDQPRVRRTNSSGMTPEDVIAKLAEILTQESPEYNPGYLRTPWRPESSLLGSDSTVSYDKNHFRANLDVQQFSPDEITVKVNAENELIVEAKHEEKQDQHGFISRHFIRKYKLPKNCDTTQLKSKLSSDGVLTLTAPTIGKQEECREIPIQQTGQPVRRVENKNTNEQNGELSKTQS